MCISIRPRAAGLPFLFVKGLTLAALAYDNIATKSAVDIDLLVPPDDLATAPRSPCCLQTTFTERLEDSLPCARNWSAILGHGRWPARR
jgi:hypothetical protein